MPKTDIIAALTPEITAIRRDIHRHPELMYDVHRTAGLVADKHQVRPHATRMHGRTAPPGQAGGRHHKEAGPEQSGAESGFGFGPVHSFDHHVAAGEKRRGVFRAQAQIMTGVLQLRLKMKQKIPQGLDFRPAQVFRKKCLAIEV